MMSSTFAIRMSFCVLFSIVTAFITRLPDCKYHGTFKITSDSYFDVDGEKQSVYNTPRRNCTMACLMDSRCVFVNHKSDDSECELLYSRAGELVDEIGWRFLTTNYTKVMEIGPVCEKTSPCQWAYYCKDVCGDKGYVCFRPDREMASSSIATQSGVYGGFSAINAIVGDEENFAITANAGNDWWQLDLRRDVHVEVISILFYYNDVQIGCVVSLTNAAQEITFSTVVGAGRQFSYTCEKLGQFVRVGVCSTPNHLWITEVKVFEMESA